MISFSFYIPNGSDVKVREGRVDSPMDTETNPLKDFKMKCTDVAKKVLVSSYSSDKSSFNIVYNN